ncbi:c-type cytochrome [Microvirga subterranea]
MLSSRGRLLTILGGTLLLAILSSIVGLSRPTPRQRQSIKPSPAPPLHLNRRAVAVGFALCAAIAIAVFTGRWYRQMEDKRQAAIALTGGNPDHGPGLMLRYGCGGCHIVQGIAGARGQVGPNLSDVSRRIYIGGVTTNSPDNLIRWIVNPREFDPKTAMPVTGISEREARDVAAFLYSR